MSANSTAKLGFGTPTNLGFVAAPSTPRGSNVVAPLYPIGCQLRASQSPPNLAVFAVGQRNTSRLPINRATAVTQIRCGDDLGSAKFVAIGNAPSRSSACIVTARLICRIFEAHLIDCDLLLALAKAGSSIPARIAMMAMTTSNSISVKALSFRRFIACPGATSAR